MLGFDTSKFKFAPQPPTVILMAGLQGSGKTTTSGKLAAWLKKGGHRPMLVSVDVYRPRRPRTAQGRRQIHQRPALRRQARRCCPSVLSQRKLFRFVIPQRKRRNLHLPPPTAQGQYGTADVLRLAREALPRSPQLRLRHSSSSTPPAASASTKPSWTRWPSSKPSSTPPRSSSSPTP